MKINSTGQTLKQYAVTEFLAALENYKLALRTGVGIIAASLQVHAAKGGVPSRYHRLVRQAFNSNGVA